MKIIHYTDNHENVTISLLKGDLIFNLKTFTYHYEGFNKHKDEAKKYCNNLMEFLEIDSIEYHNA